MNRIDNLCNEIQKEFLGQEYVIKCLRTENAHLKDEHYKDEELARMKTERDLAIKEADLGFPMTEEEVKVVNSWMGEHSKKKHGNKICGAIGGRYTYKFIPTSIGIIGEVECTCGKKFTFRELS